MPVFVHCSAAKNRECFNGSVLANNGKKQIKKPALYVENRFYCIEILKD
ncbi:hypothetical protein SAMN05443429_10342 [Cruoricaptor ignavus]|uniref:Uncharacterized protein n=1 Tax=Cruoricaptor ignavus TaxID=1118202 RepID=A0A1M6CX70_9FLAO|nr:hypothetical protein SAMN05443429_10342 [Cruoricaptor ignavus]